MAHNNFSKKNVRPLCSLNAAIKLLTVVVISHPSTFVTSCLKFAMFFFIQGFQDYDPSSSSPTCLVQEGEMIKILKGEMVRSMSTKPMNK